MISVPGTKDLVCRLSDWFICMASSRSCYADPTDSLKMYTLIASLLAWDIQPVFGDYSLSCCLLSHRRRDYTKADRDIQSQILHISNIKYFRDLLGVAPEDRFISGLFMGSTTELRFHTDRECL